MRGGAVGREILCERQVHGLGVVVEEDLDYRDADRASIDPRQAEQCGAFRAEFRRERAEPVLESAGSNMPRPAPWSKVAATTSRRSPGQRAVISRYERAKASVRSLPPFWPNDDARPRGRAAPAPPGRPLARSARNERR